MFSQRIHILGASGAGTSTLGRALAHRLGYTFLDTDDFYWHPTDPPYRKARDVTLRRELLLEALQRSPEWVLSGSLCGWGDVFVPLFELVVFLYTPTETRLARLRERERQRHGADRLRPGGDLHEHHEEFIAWASSYDTGGLEMRSLRRHEEWLSRLPHGCRAIRADGTRPAHELTEMVIGSAIV